GGGGKHFYFLYDERMSSNRINLAPGIDFKSDHGFVLAPPSNHHSGGFYRLGGGVSVLSRDSMTMMPAWLQEKIRAPKIVASVSGLVGPQSEVILEGGRNSYLTSLAGAMRRKGASQNAIQSALMSENR